MKGMMEISGTRNVKTSHAAGVRSIPKVQRSGYLELYMLGRERDRLEKEMSVLDKRRNATSRQFDDINQRVERVHRDVFKEHRIKAQAGLSPRPLKTMAINY